MRRKWILGIVFVIMIIALFPGKVNAAKEAYTPLTDFEYVLPADGAVVLTKYIAQNDTVVVPAHYWAEGAERPVVLASQGVFVKNQTVADVTILPGVSFYKNSMGYLFAECKNLRTVCLAGIDTSQITDMSYLFYNCTQLQTILGYENWDTRTVESVFYMFSFTSSLNTVDLSKWELPSLKNSGWCFQKCGAQTILLPDSLPVISAGFMNHADRWQGSVFTVPSGVRQIGFAHTMYDFGTQSFTEFRVAEGNTLYKTVDGVLYSADGKQMLAIPRGKTFPDGAFAIAEGVEFLGELSFSRNYNIRKVILPDSYQLAYVALYDPAYILYEDIGNINAGLNLHIAIYRYTGVTQYEVKGSNPYYQSRDGVIYSKDMTKLLAVPTGYAQRLEIPEGVTVWESDAMWWASEELLVHMADCSGVSIPSTMLSIAEDQMEKLNGLNKKYSGFSITISPDNPLFYLDENGNLAKRKILEDMEISLPESITVYDGTPQMPMPVICYQGQVLREGEDYTLEYADNINAGTGRVRITAKGMQYGMVECTFVIEPAETPYEVPQSLQAVFGQKQGELALPKGFAWMNPEEKVGEAGSQICLASYTSGDPNYKTMENIPVTVTVAPRVLSSEHISVMPLHFWVGSVTPSPMVTYDGVVVPEREYTVQYSGNVGYGKAELRVADIPGGNYIVEGNATFYIIPGPVYLVGLLMLLWWLTTGRILRKQKKTDLVIE